MRRALLVLTILAFAACGSSDPPEQGYIINKSYEPQHVHMHDGGTMCVSYGDDALCDISIPLADEPHTHCVGGCYKLQLKDCTITNKSKEKCRKGWIMVDAEIYRRFGIGDHFPDPR